MKVGRNDPCPCGSGKKYKHCCYAKDSVKHEPEEPEVDPAAEETDENPAEHDTSADPHTHHRDRSRFKGQTRGGSANFRAKARGSQRGG